VVEVTLDAAGARPPRAPMAFAADFHGGHENVGRLLARGRLVALRAGDRPMYAVIEDAVREPPDGYGRRRDLGELPGRDGHGVALLALLERGALELRHPLEGGAG